MSKDSPATVRRTALALAFAIITFIVLFTALSIARHRTFFWYEFEDAALFHHKMWTAAHGGFLRDTTTLLDTSNKFYPGLWLLMPFYRVHPTPETWMAIFIAMTALGAVPIFLLARRWTKSDRLALAFAVFYLAQPMLHYQTFSYFRPMRAALLLLPLMAYLFSARKYTAFLAASLAAVAFRPELAAVPVMFAGVALVARRPWNWSLGIGAGFLVLYAALSLCIIPASSGINYSAEQLTENFAASEGGFSLAAQARLMFDNVFHGEIGRWLVNIFGWQFLPAFLSPYTLIALPGVLAVAMFRQGFVGNNEVQNLTPIFPFLFIGTMHGFSVIARLLRQRRDAPFLKAFWAAALAVVTAGTLNQAIGRNIPGAVNMERLYVEDHRFDDRLNLYDPIYFREDDKDRVAWAFITMIPPEASVSATGDLLFALSARPAIFQLGARGNHFPNTDYVLMNERYLSVGAGSYRHVPPDQQARLVDDLVGSGRYELVGRERGFTLLKRISKKASAGS
ncbi:MAG: DUF2079 domain-containing protein [Deltaproteobacteria bacterium]|nr:DUF2079 domain-containing protein [Deltaproteobacteria bacterium]